MSLIHPQRATSQGKPHGGAPVQRLGGPPDRPNGPARQPGRLIPGPVARTRPHVIHIPSKFVDFSRRRDSIFVDKCLAAPGTRPVWFVLPEGAFGTVRRGEERSAQRRRAGRDWASVQAWPTADPGLAGWEHIKARWSGR